MCTWARFTRVKLSPNRTRTHILWSRSVSRLGRAENTDGDYKRIFKYGRRRIVLLFVVRSFSVALLLVSLSLINFLRCTHARTRSKSARGVVRREWRVLGISTRGVTACSGERGTELSSRLVYLPTQLEWARFWKKIKKIRFRNMSHRGDGCVCSFVYLCVIVVARVLFAATQKSDLFTPKQKPSPLYISPFGVYIVRTTGR